MQNINAYMAQALGQTLEETTNLITESLTLRHLQKHGVVTIEEATFYHNLAATVITEAAEDFIPDEVEAADPMEAGEAIELYDAAGNCYLFDPATGSLTPCDAPMEGGDMPSDPTQAPVDPTQAAEPAPVEEGYAKPMYESTEVTPAPATTVVEESTVVAEQATQIIEESTAPAQLSVVNRILANIK